MRSKDWQPSTPLSVALRRVIAREKAAIARRKRNGGRSDGLETLEPRLMMSAVHSVHTALPVIPTSVAAIVSGPATVQLQWVDKDTSVTGYNVLRSSNGGDYAQVGHLASRSTVKFTDTAVTSNTAYSYEIQAINSVGSINSNGVGATTPLVAPTALTVRAQSGTSAQLNWTNNDAGALGFYVLRASDGTHYSRIANVTIANGATFRDTGVTSGHAYSYEVQAYAGSNASAVTKGPSVTTPLAAPSRLSAIAPSSTSVALSWADNDASATGYFVLRSTDGSRYTQLTKIATPGAASYLDKTASSLKKFYYEIEAYTTAVTSPASGAASTSTPLTIPATAAASAISATSVKLSWVDTDASALGYFVLRSTNGSSFTQIGQVTGGKTNSFTDNTANSNQTFQYKIESYSGSNTSLASNVAVVMTPLATPTNLTATAQSGTVVQLQWRDNDSAATGYTVLRSGDGTNYSPIGTISSGAGVSFTDSTLSSGHAYSYEVQALVTGNTSAVSSAASAVTPLAAPSGLSALVQSSSVALTWTDNDPSAAGYNVLRSTDGTHFSQLAKLTGAATDTFTDTSTASLQNYSYEVQAYTSAANSAVSNAATVATPLAAPTAATAVAVSPASVKVTWADSDPAAGGILYLRSANGASFTQIGQLSSGKTLTYTDPTATTNGAFRFEIEAFSGSHTSLASNVAIVTTPLAAPTALTAAARSGPVIGLSWTDNDASATGYSVLRATDGVHFAQVGTITSGEATSYSDTAVTSGHSYTYEIQAFAGSNKSAVSNAAAATTPLVAPSSLTATAVTSNNIRLNWSDNDAAATGYNVLRSIDGSQYIQLAKITGANAVTYTDTTVIGGQRYYYEVAAYNTTTTSAVSNITSATAVNGGTGGVAISTRYGSELVVNATGTSDSVSVSQSGSTLTIIADGQSYTDPAPSAGLFLYTRGGSDAINIDQTVTLRTTVETIDGAVTDITSAASNVSAWTDSTDIFTGTGVLHLVGSFAGGVSKATGASLRDPTDSGPITHFTGSLWGGGPVAGDINQGSSGDCYFLSSLAAFAGEKPTVLTESAVDMGDGTYTVQYYSGTTPVDVRVSNDMPSGGFGGYRFAHPGPTGDGWALVMEKAYADFRTGANTYASLDSGWMGNVYSALGVTSTNFFPGNYSETEFYNMVSADLAQGKAVTLGTTTAPNLVSGHAYTLISASIDGNGVTHYVVRNPWGVAGDSLENSGGYATLTFAQMQANFYDGCQAA